MTLLAALLLAAVAPAGRPDPASQSTTRIEREVPAGAAWYRVTHSFGECRVLATRPNEAPHAQLDPAASGVGGDALSRYLSGIDLVVIDLPPDPDKPRVVEVRSKFPPKEQQPQGLSFAATLTLWLPEEAAVDVQNSYGRAIVDRRVGRVKVVDSLGAIEVRNVVGDVEVDDQFDQITVADVTGNVTARGKSAAITVERASGAVDVRTNGGVVRIDGAESAYAENRLKPVDVRNVRKDTTIIAPFCAVTTREIGGTLKVTSGNGSISIEGVGGDLTIDHKTGKVEARRIHGSATITGNLSDIVLTDVDGGADVHGPSAPVAVARIGGKLLVENSARTLEIVDPRGDVDASAHGGLLKLRWTQWPAAAADAVAPRDVGLVGEVGGIELELPEGAGLRLEATSSIGQIDCQIAGMSFAQAGAARTGTLELGRGPREKKVPIHATCVGGAIRVRRAPVH
jgi:hypothetical protein